MKYFVHKQLGLSTGIPARFQIVRITLILAVIFNRKIKLVYIYILSGFHI